MLYTDPGSGVLIWQMVAAGAVGAMFYLRKIFSFFRKKSDVDTKALQVETADRK